MHTKFRETHSSTLSGMHLPDMTVVTCYLTKTFMYDRMSGFCNFLHLLQKDKCVLKMEDSNPIEQSFSLGQLRRVEVKCEQIDERVRRTLKILSSIGTCLEEFNIPKI